MPESNMSISVNGQSQVPPGFRFHPTEEELLQYYLKKKVSNLRIDLDVIGDVDLNKLEPWDIQEKCRIGTTPQNDWYFFSHKDKKYPTGTRTNRATAAGFWKATGRDKAIHSTFRQIGMRKTLVFYKGRAPHGHKSDWIMHEYRLDDNHNNATLTQYPPSIEAAGQEEGWVVCRIFKKKSHHKTLDCAETRNGDDLLISSMMLDGNEDGREGALEQMFQCVKRTGCKEETTNDNSSATFVQSIMSNRNADHGYMGYGDLPGLESPRNSTGSQNWHQPLMSGGEEIPAVELGFHQTEMITSWAALDRLVASQLNGTATVDYPNSSVDDHHRVSSAVRSSSSSSSFIANPDDKYYNNTSISQQDYSNEMGLWSFARSSSCFSSTEPTCHVSDTPSSHNGKYYLK